MDNLCRKHVRSLDRALNTIVALSQEKLEFQQENALFVEALDWFQKQLILLYSLVTPSDFVIKQFGPELYAYLNFKAGNMGDLINAIRANIVRLQHEEEILQRENGRLMMLLRQHNINSD